jgi:hypothetical protein
MGIKKFKPTKKDKAFLQLMLLTKVMQDYMVVELDNMLPFKKMVWHDFARQIKEHSEYLTEISDAIVDEVFDDFGASFYNEIVQLAQAQLNTLIKEDNYYQDAFIVSGIPMKVVFEDDKNGNINIISISKPIPETSTEELCNKVKLKYKANSVKLGIIEPYRDPSEVKHLINTVIKDVHDTTYVVTGASYLDNELKLTIQRNAVITSEQLSMQFTTLKNEKLGRNV